MLHVSPDLLPALYDGHPKVLIVKSKAQSWTFVPPTNTVRWLIAEKSDTGGFILTGAADTATGTDHHLLDMPPTNVWVVWNPHDEDQAAGLAQWWAGAGGIGAEPSFIDGDAAKLNAALFERARAEVTRLTQANQLLIEDLAALRESWAQDVRLPPELEDLLANLRLAPPRLIFETAAPTVDAKTVQAAMGGGKAPHLCQRLPIGAHGLLGIDVHVAVPGSGNGHLRVSLFVRETENALAHWEIAYDELKPGWLPLRLPAALTLRSHGLELRVHATGGVNAPKFTCSPVGLLPEYSCTSTGSETAGDTMLAFKLWGGIPGTKANTGLSMTPLPADPVMAIPEHTVAAAKTTRELTWAYPYFGYLKGGRVLLRPLRENPASAASISLPAIPGISAVSCQATIDDGLCKTRLLVRLAVTRPGHNADEAEQGIGVLASTAWIELAEPLKPFPLTIRLPEPLSSPIDIHFFSRLPRGGTLEHGRVIFDGFEAALSDRAAWQCAPVMPLATP